MMTVLRMFVRPGEWTKSQHGGRQEAANGGATANTLLGALVTLSKADG
jgi:hypothetical protein